TPPSFRAAARRASRIAHRCFVAAAHCVGANVFLANEVPQAVALAMGKKSIGPEDQAVFHRLQRMKPTDVGESIVGLDEDRLSMGEALEPIQRGERWIQSKIDVAHCME